MFLALNFTLYSSIVDFAYFLRVKPRPFLIVKSLIKRFNIFHANKVNEGVSHVAVIKEIDWEVKEVKLIFEPFIQCHKHLLLSVLIRDIPNHQRGPSFLHDPLRNYFESVVISYPLAFIHI